ncbi:protein SPEAR1-like isoform X1 [Typha latifolia]|uniref:protein SPEAR1-like isoform X1 n=1 Tax=Typha latifolia TaxID=4733 RepID=UPI003C2D1F44
MGDNLGEFGFSSGRPTSLKKGRKSNSEKPKQPQRGLGVAQLEKIRLQSEMTGYHHPSLQSSLHDNLNMEDAREMASSSSSSSIKFTTYHPNFMISYGTEGSNAKYCESLSSSIIRPQFSHHNISTPHYDQSTVTLPLFNQCYEDSAYKRRHHHHHRSESVTDSASPNSDSGNTQELDLDLKL